MTPIPLDVKVRVIPLLREMFNKHGTAEVIELVTAALANAEIDAGEAFTALLDLADAERKRAGGGD